VVDVPVVVPREVPPVGSTDRLVLGLVLGIEEFAVVIGVLVLYRCAISRA
jgi:hypothetical protein